MHHRCCSGSSHTLGFPSDRQLFKLIWERCWSNLWARSFIQLRRSYLSIWGFSHNKNVYVSYIYIWLLMSISYSTTSPNLFGLFRQGYTKIGGASYLHLTEDPIYETKWMFFGLMTVGRCFGNFLVRWTWRRLRRLKGCMSVHLPNHW